ncbi:MAG: right-handed parallel beta-helix repeat-containing protein, partial [Acidimicrobiia bacterium]|nr:right-handed parallel beta-helix repeat-containing protein [Acidimicrobiia bacterium]
MSSTRAFSRVTTVLAAACMVALLLVIEAGAATLPAACPGPPTLQSIIDGAAPGDTIAIGPGTCTENLTISKDLILQGSGAGATILDGGNAGTTVTVGSGATVSIAGVTIRGGVATEGGGIFNQGALDVSNSTIADNQAVERGAGILNDSGSTLVLTRTLVADNVAQLSGGGVYSRGDTSTITVTDSEFDGNQAVEENGGGINISDSDLSVSRSTLSANTAGNDGGGLYAVGTGTVTLGNVTVSGNTAGSDTGLGGGVFLRDPPLTVSHATIYENGAFRGGGLWVAGGTVTLGSTILTGNHGTSGVAPNPDCGQFGAVTVTSGGFNLWGADAPTNCAFAAAATDLVGADARLGPLLDSGGPPTHGLLIGSAARDAVTSGCPPPSTDARGVPRPQGPGCDIGAFEAASTEPNTVGLVDPNSMQWHLLDPLGNETTFWYGAPGDFPIVGDWDCDGTDTPGAYRQSDGFVYLRNSNTTGAGQIRFFLGNPGDIPLAGDFNGDGCDTVSVYRQSLGRVFIANSLGANDGIFVADFDYYFGIPGDKPFVGDFDGDGIDTVGLHRESSGFVYFINRHETAFADSQFFYGIPRDRLVTADWSVNGRDTVAIFRPDDRTFYFRFTNTLGFANDTLV